MSKTEGGHFGETFFQENYTMPEKTERGDPLGIFNIHSVAKDQKNEGGLFEDFSRKKSHNAERKLKEDPLVSSDIVCYAEKEEKPILFSSLGQMIQLATTQF